VEVAATPMGLERVRSKVRRDTVIDRLGQLRQRMCGLRGVERQIRRVSWLAARIDTCHIVAVVVAVVVGIVVERGDCDGSGGLVITLCHQRQLAAVVLDMVEVVEEVLDDVGATMVVGLVSGIEIEVDVDLVVVVRGRCRAVEEHRRIGSRRSN